MSALYAITPGQTEQTVYELGFFFLRRGFKFVLNAEEKLKVVTFLLLLLDAVILMMHYEGGPGCAVSLAVCCVLTL